MAEVFSGRPDESVIGPSVPVVEGAVWDNISLINTRKGEDMN
jgi:hypothetical protein